MAIGTLIVDQATPARSVPTSRTGIESDCGDGESTGTSEVRSSLRKLARSAEVRSSVCTGWIRRGRVSAVGESSSRGSVGQSSRLTFGWASRRGWAHASRCSRRSPGLRRDEHRPHAFSVFAFSALPGESGAHILHRPDRASRSGRFSRRARVRIEHHGASRRFGMSVVLVAAASLLGFVITACGGSKTTGANASVKLEITAPADGSSVRADRVAVRGTVTPSDATVQILGRSVQVGNGVFAGSVPLHRGANTIDVVASAAGSAPATATITVNRPAAPTQGQADRAKEDLLSPAQRTAAAVSPLVPIPRARRRERRAAFESSGSGVSTCTARRQARPIACTARSGLCNLCTGGNGASVYFTNGGASTPTPWSVRRRPWWAPTLPAPSSTNVQTEYYLSGPGWISVDSPVTNLTYDMYCTSSSPHVCTGGNNAAVYFP